MDTKELISMIRARRASASPGSTLLVAIDGRGGSGKTNLAEALTTELPGVTVVHTDDFAIPGRSLPLPSGDQGTDWERLTRQIVRPVREGTNGRYQRYSWDTDALEEWVEIPTGVILIVEGIGTLGSEFREKCDIRVWVECAREICLHRGRERDGAHSSLAQWEIWQAGEDRYIVTELPIDHADLVVSGGE